MKDDGMNGFMPEALSDLLEAAVEGGRESGTEAEALRCSLDLLREGWTEPAIQRLAALVQRQPVPAAYLMLSAGYMLADECDCALTILDLLRLSDPYYAEAAALQGLFLRRLGRPARGEGLRPVRPEQPGGWSAACESAA